MSTAAIIGIKRGRTIRSIYCHNDGDLFGVGSYLIMSTITNLK